MYLLFKIFVLICFPISGPGTSNSIERILIFGKMKSASDVIYVTDVSLSFMAPLNLLPFILSLINSTIKDRQ